MEGSESSAGVNNGEGLVILLQHLLHEQGYLVGVGWILEGARWGLNGRREGILRVEKGRGMGWRQA